MSTLKVCVIMNSKEANSNKKSSIIHKINTKIIIETNPSDNLRLSQVNSIFPIY